MVGELRVLRPSAGAVPPLISGNEPGLGPVKNCAGCGLVLALADFASMSRCPHCERPLAMRDAKRRQAEGEDLEGLRRAVELRNRLLEYDKQTATLTRVLDDDGKTRGGADYSQWDTEQDRTLAMDLAQAEEAQARQDARLRMVDLDLSSASLVDTPRLAPSLTGSSLRVFQMLQKGE